MVVWIIGLSGAGKTTLGESIVSRVRGERENIVLLDGDQVREAFGNDLGHSLEDRWKNADRICRLCHLLDRQRIHVVCCILSLFPDSRRWNRMNLSRYLEIFIDVPLDTLIRRDPRGLYGKALDGRLRNVAGIDIAFSRPLGSDLVIDDPPDRETLLSHAPAIARRILDT